MFEEILASQFFGMLQSLALLIFSAFMIGVCFWIWRPTASETYTRIARDACDTPKGKGEAS